MDNKSFRESYKCDIKCDIASYPFGAEDLLLRTEFGENETAEPDVNKNGNELRE